MKPILTLSGIALVISTHTALADRARLLDPHEQARQLILSATQHSVAFRGATEAAALAPADPHEFARRRIAASTVTDVVFRPAPTTAPQQSIDTHERARRSIVGLVPHHPAALAR